MLSDSDIDDLAKSVLTRVVTELNTWVENETKPIYAMSTDRNGEVVLTYAGHSVDGYGTFVCDYKPIEAIRTIIRRCEGTVDKKKIEVTEKETTEINEFPLSEFPVEDQRGLIEMMAETATLYVLYHLAGRLGNAIVDAVYDADLIAQGAITVASASRLSKSGVDAEVDARQEIELAAQRAANAKREMLRNQLKQLPFVIAQRNRGAPRKSQREREQQRAAYESKLETTYRDLLVKNGNKPTKTLVARTLGEGGINPKTGIDSSLAAFRNKLKRLNIDYDALVEKITDKLNDNP